MPGQRKLTRLVQNSNANQAGYWRFRLGCSSGPKPRFFVPFRKPQGKGHHCVGGNTKYAWHRRPKSLHATGQGDFLTQPNCQCITPSQGKGDQGTSPSMWGVGDTRTSWKKFTNHQTKGLRERGLQFGRPSRVTKLMSFKKSSCNG